MFASLKNKIKEETGSDLTNLAPILTNPPLKISPSLFKGRHSRQGSGSSIGSISLDSVPADSVNDEPPPSPTSSKKLDVSDLKLSDGRALSAKEMKRFEKREDDWKRKLQKKEEEWTKKMEKREEEFKKQLEEQQKEWKRSLELLEKEKNVLEEEKREVVKQKLNLEETVKVAEEYKKKVIQYQEDIDQLEGFQTQEMAKIKHLLLVKEQELAERAEALKESSSQIEGLRVEVSRIHRYEEELSNLQDELETLRHGAQRERARLASSLAQAEEEARHLRDRVAVLERRASAECAGLGAPLSTDERVTALLGERALLERRLEEAHLHLADIKSSWSDKIAALETQVGRLSRQAGEEGAERRRAEAERAALEAAAEQSRDAAAGLRAERDALAAEVERLRGQQRSAEQRAVELGERIDAAGRDRAELQTELTVAQARAAASEQQLQQVTACVESERGRAQELQSQLQQTQAQLQEEQQRSGELQGKLGQERQDKDAILLRNAQVSQEVQLAQQAAREQQREHAELLARTAALQEQLAAREKELEQQRAEAQRQVQRLSELEGVQHSRQQAQDMERELRQALAQLEEQLADKNKSVRVLQQRLLDMKKTMQRELRGPAHLAEPSTPAHDTDGLVPYPAATNHSPRSEEVDINFKYLKHVLIKFLTSREYEACHCLQAQHLTRAVATLLKFTPEEERLLRETLEWKMSWFGTRPSLGMGQTSKTIPPS